MTTLNIESTLTQSIIYVRMIILLKLLPHLPGAHKFTHWGRVTHICVSILTIIGSDNGLSPGPRQAITWTNAAILLIGTLRANFSEIFIRTGPRQAITWTNAAILLIGTLRANFSEIFIRILTFLLKKMRFKESSAKWRPYCRGLNGLTAFLRYAFCVYVHYTMRPQTRHHRYPCVKK